ncbi:protein of unknown function [uncultured Sphingopyxis sp.]|uniref:Uncharacterized protein n=1 Tax=uncultured Sphingopyxis sp. TaxID=310581 RepID=A0A1Y5PUA8_9SPHN|nr:protein of unknown function [uncultured Sphingopyxis sp.]
MNWRCDIGRAAKAGKNWRTPTRMAHGSSGWGNDSSGSFGVDRRRLGVELFSPPAGGRGSETCELVR